MMALTRKRVKDSHVPLTIPAMSSTKTLAQIKPNYALTGPQAGEAFAEVCRTRHACI